MRLGSILMLIAAAVLAVFAGILAQSWLEQQRGLGQSGAVESKIHIGQIVVATQPLRFGSELSAANLREVEWPTAAIPVGAFSSKAELLKANERRVVLSAIEANEPILKWKITGPGQRASLSSLIELPKKAVTIRVNDVFGVGGFVLPGDRVDVLLTRTDVAQGHNNQQMYSDVLLQHVRVLGIDQLADDRTERASVVKAVTLEVGTEDAQRLALAGTVGSLSLVLRPAGSTTTARTHRITAADLAASSSNMASAADVEPNRGTSMVGVTRTGKRRQYTVTVETALH